MSLIGKDSTIMLRDKIIEGLDEISYAENTNPDIMCFQDRTATVTLNVKGTNSQILKLKAALRREYKRKISRKKKKRLKKIAEKIAMNAFKQVRVELEAGNDF